MEEIQSRALQFAIAAGLKPQMAYTVRQTALLPAHAVMIPTVRVQTQKVVAAPRTRGDDPFTGKSALNNLLCSPHTRG